MDIPANSVTLTLGGVEEELRFTPVRYSFVSIANLGSDNIQVSRTPDISSRLNGLGIITITPGSSICTSTLNGAIYVLGSGLITVIGSDSAENPFKIASKGGGGNGAGGVTDYNDLQNKPKIEGVELYGNKKLSDFGLSAMTEEETNALIKRVKGE